MGLWFCAKLAQISFGTHKLVLQFGQKNRTSIDFENTEWSRPRCISEYLVKNEASHKIPAYLNKFPENLTCAETVGSFQTENIFACCSIFIFVSFYAMLLSVWHIEQKRLLLFFIKSLIQWQDSPTGLFFDPETVSRSNRQYELFSTSKWSNSSRMLWPGWALMLHKHNLQKEAQDISFWFRLNNFSFPFLMSVSDNTNPSSVYRCCFNVTTISVSSERFHSLVIVVVGVRESGVPDQPFTVRYWAICHTAQSWYIQSIRFVDVVK